MNAMPCESARGVAMPPPHRLYYKGVPLPKRGANSETDSHHPCTFQRKGEGIFRHTPSLVRPFDRHEVYNFSPLRLDI